MQNLELDRPTGIAPSKNPVRRYSLLLPFLVVVVALTFSTAREALAFHKRKVALVRQNQQMIAILDKSSKQIEALRRIQSEIEKLSSSDPITAKIALEFFSMRNPADHSSAEDDSKANGTPSP